MQARERREDPARSDLDEDTAVVFHERPDPVGEAHCVPEMTDPVLGVGRLFGRDPRAAHVRDERPHGFRVADPGAEAAELVQDRIEHRRVRRDVDVDAAALDILGEELGFQRLQRIGRAARHAQVGGVGRRDREGGGEPCLQLLGGERHAQHAARRHRLEQFPADRDERQRRFQREHTGEMGRGVLAHRMPDHGVGLDAPRHEQPRHRVLRDEQAGQRPGGPLELARRGFRIGRAREQQRLQAPVELGLEHGHALVHGSPVDGLVAVEALAHAGVLRAATREHERDRPRDVGRLAGRRRPRIGVAQKFRGLVGARRHDEAPVGEALTPLLECERDVGQRGRSIFRQIGGELPARGVQRGRRLRRHGQQLGLPGRRLARPGGRRLLQNDVRVRAARSERRHASDPVGALLGPRVELGRHVERRVLDVEPRVRLLEVKVRRDLGVLQRLDRLDETRHAGGRVEVADVRLHRPDPDRRGCLHPGERLGERQDLDGITDRCGGPVAFDVADVGGIDPGDGERFGHVPGLRIHARREIPDLGGPVVVDRGAFDDRVDRVPVPQCVRQAAEHDCPGAAAEDGALCIGVERPALAVRRQDLALFVRVPQPVRLLERAPPGERHVALVEEQALAGEMYRDQRGRAGRLHVHARTGQVHQVRDAGRQEVLVVAGVPKQEEADVLGQLPVREQVPHEVEAGPAAGEHADRPQEAFGSVSRVLHGRPRHLQEVALLRIHDLRLAGREAEEAGVEALHVLHGMTSTHVIRRAQLLVGRAVLAQLVFLEPDGRVDAVAHVLPETGHARSAGQTASRADDGDVGLRIAEGQRAVTHIWMPLIS